MRYLLVASLVFVSSALASERPSDVVDYLAKRMGGESVHLKGRTDIMTDCAIDFVVENGNLLATYSDAEGPRRHVRGVFEVKAKTKVKAFDAKNGTAIVDNVYVENLGNGQTRKSTYRARIEVETDNRGLVTFVNVGWNSDKGRPFMYGCAILN